MVSSGENNYKCVIGCKDFDYKIKLMCIMLPKMSAYVMMVKLNGWIFWLMTMNC